MSQDCSNGSLALYMVKKIFIILVAAVVLQACLKDRKEDQATDEPASETIDPTTGLIVADELPLIISNCTACHSAKLITQNRATREGWKSMIVWMQETQDLWDLGPNEDKILDYLARYYAPEKIGRRKNLKDIEWYDLKEIEKLDD